MPISPENMKLYPGGSIRSPDWLAIRERIKARAQNRCEECGVKNGAIGVRMSDGAFAPIRGATADIVGRRVTVPVASPTGYAQWTAKAFRIVCTVAHVDGKLVDHSDANLRFWCQRCHNRNDAASRRANAAITIHDRRAGTKDMFGRQS